MAVTRSWVDIAEGSDFPLENLPLGVFRRADGVACVGSAIGDRIFDLHAAADAGLLVGDLVAACGQDSLNTLMAMGRAASSALRARLTELLSDGGCPGASSSLFAGGAGRGSDAASGAHWRLHRFLCFGVSRDERGSAVSSGESAAAELQVCSDWISRAGFFDCC